MPQREDEMPLKKGDEMKKNANKGFHPPLMGRRIADPESMRRMEKEMKLAAFRADILAKPPEKALDALLDAPFPTALIQSFPDQDLHFLMYHIGEDDFLPILSRATSTQWEYLLDVEVWQKDRIDPIAMTRMLSLLFKADPQRLLRWSIMEKPEFMEHYFSRFMEIRVREHDEDPSDFGEGFETLDSVIYFRFPLTMESAARSGAGDEDEAIVTGMDPRGGGWSDVDGVEDKEVNEDDEDHATVSMGEMMKSAEAAELLITEMLGTLAKMDLSVCQGVLMETASIIPAEIEEEAFRLKTVRLAEKGFLPYHEAVAIFQPLDPAGLSERPDFYLGTSLYGNDLPLPPQFPFSSKMGENLFVQALKRVDDALAVNFQAEFAFLVNALISTEKAPIRSMEGIQKSVETCCAYLGVGLEKIYGTLMQRDAYIDVREDHTDAREDHTDERESQTDQREDHTDSYVRPSLDAAADMILRYPLKEIFRVGSGAALSVRKEAKRWYEKSWIASRSLHLAFLDETWLGIVGGALLDRPLFFDNYVTGSLYRPFASLDEIETTTRQLRSVALMDRVLGVIDPDSVYFISPFVTWKAVLLTLWVINRMGLDASADPFIPFSRFKPFFSQLFSGPDELVKSESNGSTDRTIAHGKIDCIVREDFVHWLSEHGAWPKDGGTAPESVERSKEADEAPLSQSSDEEVLKGVVDDLFDELEEAYGDVSAHDLDAELITHFILDANQ